MRFLSWRSNNTETVIRDRWARTRVRANLVVAFVALAGVLPNGATTHSLSEAASSLWSDWGNWNMSRVPGASTAIVVLTAAEPLAKVASKPNGGFATTSSTSSLASCSGPAINGNRCRLGCADPEGWAEGGGNGSSYREPLQVRFNGRKSIGQVEVHTLDHCTAPAAPTPSSGVPMMDSPAPRSFTSGNPRDRTNSLKNWRATDGSSAVTTSERPPVTVTTSVPRSQPTVSASNLPAWVPQLGKVVAFTTNTAASLDPCPQRTCSYSGGVGQRGVTLAWNGGAFASEYGKFGAIAFSGGGDGDYWGNEVYVADIESRLFKILAAPSPVAGAKFVPATPNPWGEWWDGSPGMPHTYGYPVYQPPSMGGGTKGSLLLPKKPYWYGTRGSAAAHRFDLATGVWSRASTAPATSGAAPEAWAFDASRQRFVGQLIGSGSPVTGGKFRTLESFTAAGVGTHNSVGLAPVTTVGSSGTAIVIPEFDAFIMFGYGGAGVGMTLKGYDMTANFAASSLRLTGETVPGGSGGPGLAWVPETRTLYVRIPTPGNEQFLWALKPGANWKEDLWTVTKVTMGGETVQGSSSNGMWGRFAYAPKIGSLVFVTDTTRPAFAFRVWDGTATLQQ